MSRLLRALLLLTVAWLITGLTSLVSGEAVPLPADGSGRCEDFLVGVASVTPIDSDFFRTAETSHKWWIVEGDDGSLEDTMYGQIDPEDLLRVEHTAQCTSTHQGEHRMNFCYAEATANGVKLTISGGMPAYASDLTMSIGAKLDFRCSFNAVYPRLTNPLWWKITKKTLKLREKDFAPGRRMRGWLSVEFEEIDEVTKESRSHRIEGYIKPVITSAAKLPQP